MNSAPARIVAWALIGLHLADALLVSGGSWLARYAHQHLGGCSTHCCHAAPADLQAVAQRPKKSCCGHRHHAHVAKSEDVPSQAPAVASLPAHGERGPCDDCAACRHERQSVLAVTSWQFVAVQPLVVAATPDSHLAPALALVRGFDSRGPPAVTL